jgi:BirA family transcriptional regulator, biotin operon repressor / biotin---[acetyl-CoA-carboxylase] ligase
VTSDPVLASRWEGHPPHEWRARWRVPELEIHEAIGSTNDRARGRAAAGSAAGTLIMAEHQTAGRGRLGRRWQAPPSSSLLMSFLLRPAAPAEGTVTPGVAPLRIGLAVANAIADVTGVECALKWPNDLVVTGRGKLAGILCEAVMSSERDAYVVAGIGINVRQRADDWPETLRGHATSVDACAGHASDRAALAGAIVDAVRPLFDAPLRPLSTDERDVFARRDALRGQTVIIDGDATGVVRGVDADGALVVETADGLHRLTNASPRVATTARTTT